MNSFYIFLFFFINFSVFSIVSSSSSPSSSIILPINSAISSKFPSTSLIPPTLISISSFSPRFSRLSLLIKISSPRTRQISEIPEFHLSPNEISSKIPINSDSFDSPVASISSAAEAPNAQPPATQTAQGNSPTPPPPEQNFNGATGSSESMQQSDQSPFGSQSPVEPTPQSPPRNFRSSPASDLEFARTISGGSRGIGTPELQAFLIKMKKEQDQERAQSESESRQSQPEPQRRQQVAVSGTKFAPSFVPSQLQGLMPLMKLKDPHPAMAITPINSQASMLPTFNQRGRGIRRPGTRPSASNFGF